MIIILNFGSQFAHLIARRVRDMGVHSEIVPHNITAKEVQEMNPTGIIFSGGPDSVTAKKAPKIDTAIYSLDIPILGICYGQQLIAHDLGGVVEHSDKSEYGKEVVSVHAGVPLFDGCKKQETVWFSHGDQVTKLPKGFKKTASTHTCRYAGIQNAKKKIFGVQFHPEVTHTRSGRKILKNFLFDICHAKKDWKITSLKKDLIKQIRAQVKDDEHVLVAVSGGVDSLVTATLVYEAIGDRMHAVLVDTGLLRKNEVEEVKAGIQSLGMDWLQVVNAAPLFFKRLKGVTDPEKKRKIIGHTFIEVFEKYVRTKLKKYNIVYLVQGTIYPDRIESAEPNKQASKIKSHHNLTLPKKMKLKVIEPIRDLYKDEVRKLGRALHLPQALLNRHPFPGPGLAIRILGEVTKKRVALLQEADAIYMEELHNTGHYHKIWQAFAALLPVRSVGVMGDSRTYESIITLRAVNSVDGMTADWYPFPPKVSAKISNRIINEVNGVNRVLYDITQKPPGTIEYE